MRVIALLQTRYNSTRLPGKAVKRLCGEPMIWHLYRRMLKASTLDGVCCAIGADKSEPILDVCDDYAMKWRVGDEKNLLSRLIDAGLWMGADAVVRVTGDCVFHDPTLIDRMVTAFRNVWPETRGLANWPRRYVSEGLDCEIYGMELLLALDRMAQCPREDFATYAVNEKLVANYSPTTLGGTDQHMSIDTYDDFVKAEKVMKAIGPLNFNYRAAMLEWMK